MLSGYSVKNKDSISLITKNGETLDDLDALKELIFHKIDIS